MEGFCSRLESRAKAGWTTVSVKEGDGFPGELHSDLPLQLSWWEDQVQETSTYRVQGSALGSGACL